MHDYSFEIKQGCDFELDLELFQDDEITPFPLTAYAGVNCDFGDSKTLEKIGSFAAAITDSVNGKIKLTLTSAETDIIPTSTFYKYTAQLRAFTASEPAVNAFLLDLAFSVEGELR